MKYELIIFDMDGTFIDSKEFHAKVFFDFFQKNCVPVTYEYCYRSIGKTVRQVFEAVDLLITEYNRYYDLLNDYYMNEGTHIIHLTKVAEDFKKFLSQVKKYGIKTAVITNSLNCVTEQILKYHSLNMEFDNVIGADKESLDKISRCKALLKQRKILPEKVLLVGDTESDIELANYLGIDACFAKTSIAWYQDSDYIEKELKPCMIVKDYLEFSNILKTLV